MSLKDGFQKDYKIVLGSTSESRRKVLSSANIQVSEYVSADIDERNIEDNDPNKLAMRLSDAKMKAVLEKLSYGRGKDKVIVICADTIALKDGEVRNKPEGYDEKLRFLNSYSGSFVDCITGLTVYNYFTETMLTDVDISRVHYKTMSEKDIQEIIDGSKIIGYSCGGVATDCPIMGRFVEKIEGDAENVLGISVEKTVKLIQSSIA
ncbi:septum formation protein Maf [Cryptosporidium felis]|nr:septum formation protein Maf [Cryptosporidium felis]